MDTHRPAESSGTVSSTSSCPQGRRLRELSSSMLIRRCPDIPKAVILENSIFAYHSSSGGALLSWQNPYEFFRGEKKNMDDSWSRKSCFSKSQLMFILEDGSPPYLTHWLCYPTMFLFSFG
ncbi:hypothetical protein TNCV_53031 [Trichonephila clavipes]|nr:hypothetical protein TNCV_53031 [Trichonephila clavipes]